MWNNKWKISLWAFTLLVIIGASLFVGYSIGHTRSIVIADSKTLINKDFSLFWEATDVVRQKYVDASAIKDDELLYGSIKGMVASLGDPYSDFFSPEDAKKFDEDLKGSFGGIGAEIGLRDGQVVVISPLKGNPAEAAGIKPLDKIVKINDTITAHMSVEEAVKLIRGNPGTQVTLLLFREGWKDTKEFKITRAVINVPTLDSEVKTLSNGTKVTYMHLYNFNANVPELFYKSAMAALADGSKGIILDVRNNPGGFLDVAVDLGGWFLERGKPVVKEKSRTGEETIRYADGNAGLAALPIVVLVNEGSASASEILAGAIRDVRGAKLIGMKTFGKGSVQEVIDLKDGSKLKVTIAHWFTPNGTKIDKTGLKPDIEVKISDADAEKKKDPQLEKALEVIMKEIK